MARTNSRNIRVSDERAGARTNARGRGHAGSRPADRGAATDEGRRRSRSAARGGRPRAQADGGRSRAAVAAGSSTQSRYVPALDGLRALAVLAVIFYHMMMPWAPGGLLGVTIFFVLSGYLITGLLLREFGETGTISLSNFWLRRVRRIIPAVVFAVLGTAFLCTIFNHALLTRMRPDVIPSLLFFNNWWQIFNGASYFENIGNSPLQHFWSLSIEEQFYLIWPVVLLLCMKFGVSKKNLMRGVVVLIVLSAVNMALQYSPNVDPSRVYFGTDTRAFSLLIGSLLAFVWPYQRLRDGSGGYMDGRQVLILNVAGIASVVGLLIMIGTVDGYSPFNYRGGLVLCSLLTAVAIASMVHPASWIGRFFALGPLVWIGKISYSMYLWHWPIILLMTGSNVLGSEVPIIWRIVQLIVIFAISAFSYYVVENPIRHGALGAFLSDWRSGEFTLGMWVRDHMVPFIVGAAIVLVSIGGLLLAPSTSFLGNEAAVRGETDTSSDVTAATAPAKDKYDILMIGDSVSVRTIPYFEETFPFGKIDSMQNRQLYEAPDIYAAYRDDGVVGDVVVFALGTNGYVVEEQTDALMDEVGSDKKVWFVNTRSTTEFMDASNQALADCCAKYDNAELIDWYSLSADHPEYFDGDGTHLTDEAAQIYTQMIYDVTSSYLPKHTEEELEEKRAENAGEVEPGPETPEEFAQVGIETAGLPKTFKFPTASATNGTAATANANTNASDKSESEAKSEKAQAA